MITEIVKKHYTAINKEKHHRYKSWEHCYNCFRDNKKLYSEEKIDLLSLHLGFYLANWGMYRGTSFLVQKDYKLHSYVVEVLYQAKYDKLWNMDIDDTEYEENIGLIIELKDEITKAYSDNINRVKGKKTDVNVTDTLSSKIILGTTGSVPAYDRYFTKGLEIHGFKFKKFDERSLKQILDFYHLFSKEFDSLKKLTREDGLEYPITKLLDMYFWQVGYMIEYNEITEKELEAIEKYKDIFVASQVEEEEELDDTCEKKRSNNSYKKTVISMIKEAVASLGAEFNKTDIKKYIHDNYGDVNDGTINCQIAIGIVNRESRVNWYPNKKERVTNTKYDLIYDKGNGKLEKYDIKKHGLWEIKLEKGKYCIERVEEIR